MTRTPQTSHNGHSMLGYIRCSTADQAHDGYGLEAQKASIQDACQHRGWTLQHIYTDAGVSGTHLERPALQQALSTIAQGQADGLVVAKLDRLSRSVVDFATLLAWFGDANARFVALDLDIDTTTPGGELVAHVFAAVARWEVRTISQRTRDGLRAARAQGRPISRPSLHDQQELSQRIRDMRERGWGLTEICEALNLEKVPTLRGGVEWRPSSLQGLLGAPRRARRYKTQLPEVRR